MEHPRYTAEEIVQRGEALYEQQIRSQVDPKSIGKYIVIDIETGSYEIGDDYHALAHQMLAQKPDAALCVVRIGHVAAGRIGGRSQVTQR